MLAQYEIVARALVVPSDSGGTDVRLYAEETQFSTAYPKGYTMRVRSTASGRAGRTWASLVAIAAQVQPDSTRWSAR